MKSSAKTCVMNMDRTLSNEFTALITCMQGSKHQQFQHNNIYSNSSSSYQSPAFGDTIMPIRGSLNAMRGPSPVLRDPSPTMRQSSPVIMRPTESYFNNE